MKIIALALLGMITCSTAFAETVAPFESDGCVPGFNELGQFVDENDKVLDSEGWVATAEKTVLDAEGQQVYLKSPCVAVTGATAMAGGGMGVAVVLGVAAVALAASSTNGTN